MSMMNKNGIKYYINNPDYVYRITETITEFNIHIHAININTNFQTFCFNFFSFFVCNEMLIT